MGHFILVDTSAWVAFFVEKDQHHDSAKSFAQNILLSRREFMTTDYIFDEVVTRIRYQASHADAVFVGDKILSSPSNQVIEIGSRLREQAWSLFKKYKDKKLSFTDCTSLALMKKYGLDEIFSFDDDFEKLGYRKRPG
ncbi:MAG: type II toxin-antitoxin system VapC family toxin [Planctomycetes bacterium]|nr:type II toxin-antitoxin system VapC family toxin [Planctomycetota bacterium]